MCHKLFKTQIRNTIDEKRHEVWLLSLATFGAYWS